MSYAEWDRRLGFFDGLHGREPRPLLCSSEAYTEGYKRGRDVWRRPRRKRPKPQVSPNVQEWTL